jgi:uncharacterized membrane protein YfcA
MRVNAQRVVGAKTEVGDEDTVKILAAFHGAKDTIRGGTISMRYDLLYILLGLSAGVLSGMMGIGGGLIIVPALVLLGGFSQHEAQGTTLALMVPPIGLPAAWAYYKNGYVNVEVAILVCIGFFVGGFLGAKMANLVSTVVLERIFGVAMLVIALKMLVAR